MDVLRIIARAVDENGIDPDNLNLTTTDPRLIQMQKKYCKIDLCPIEWATMHYRPIIPGNAAYAGCLAALLAAQLFYGIRKKTWSYMGAVSMGVLGEIVGYIGRIMLNRNPFLMNNFLINLIPLTIAPALLTAGIYLCLGRVITAIGSGNSRLKPKMYSIVFVGCDLLALVLQAIGGSSDMGVKIMIAGLISQVVSMVLFFLIWGDFILRTRRAKLSGSLARTQPPLYDQLRSTKTFKFFQWSLFIAAILIFIRCLYRVAELWEGFDGELANHESTFMIFEGPMIIGAVLAMTVFHPGRAFNDLWIPAGKGVHSINGLGDSAAKVEPMEGDEWNHRADTAYHRV
ncbi:RTA1-domain-containing protein [Zopfia rhizophila CBS 207.26]|uniref:RTA1-domain-containing protein n=1 Tax=Zopfia rhizophila CBS 207.26 TaxID=1314779 RepID=A0A6A6D7F1_9PEZI|nr:RTA1-domain-containing protein [Zopfia rhizophila CBS 207.26]